MKQLTERTVQIPRNWNKAGEKKKKEYLKNMSRYQTSSPKYVRDNEYLPSHGMKDENGITVIPTIAAFKALDPKYKKKIEKIKEMIPDISKSEAEEIYMHGELYELDNDLEIESTISIVNRVERLGKDIFDGTVDEDSKSKAEEELKALFTAGMNGMFE